MSTHPKHTVKVYSRDTTDMVSGTTDMVPEYDGHKLRPGDRDDFVSFRNNNHQHQNMY